MECGGTAVGIELWHCGNGSLLTNSYNAITRFVAKQYSPHTICRQECRGAQAERSFYRDKQSNRRESPDCRLYSRNKFHILQLRSTFDKLLTPSRAESRPKQMDICRQLVAGLWYRALGTCSQECTIAQPCRLHSNSANIP